MRHAPLLIAFVALTFAGACREPSRPDPPQAPMEARDREIPQPRVESARVDDVGATERLTRDELACREAPADHGEACLRAADLYERGRGAAVNHARARELMRAACEAGHREGCVLLSLALIKGQPDLRTSEEAAELARKPCADGVPEGCYALGTILHRELLPAGEIGAGTALDLFDRGCDGGHARSCDMLGRLHFAGRGGAAKDRRLAVDYYKRACKLGAELSCQKAEMPASRRIR